MSDHELLVEIHQMLSKITETLYIAREKKMSRPAEAEHGTRAGYNRHLREGTVTCDACRAANTNYASRMRVKKRAMREFI